MTMRNPQPKDDIDAAVARALSATRKRDDARLKAAQKIGAKAADPKTNGTKWVMPRRRYRGPGAL